MVLPTKVDSVDIHTAVISPVIGESDDKLNADFCRRIDYLVKVGDVDGRGAIRKPLKDRIRCACTLASVLR